MKIAFVYDAVYPHVKGGVEKRISDVAKQLAHRGHDVHVIGEQSWGASRRVVDSGVTYHGVTPSRSLYTRTGRRSAIQGILFALRLMPIIARDRFDVIETQSTTPLATLVVWLLSRSRQQKVVIVWHEVWDRHWVDYAGFVGVGARFLERLCAKLPATHISPSRTSASKLEALGSGPVEVVPLGIDLKLLADVDPSPTESDVIYVGRLVRGKNVDLLLEALRVLQDKGITPQVLVVGDGPDRRRLETSVRSLRLQNVSFTGSIQSHEDVLALMKSSKVFASPSSREGFGLTVLEAACCGLPVATVDHPENAARELVPEDLLVPVGDSHEFAARLAAAISDDGQSPSSTDGVPGGVSRFEEWAVIDRLESIYAEKPCAPAST